MPYYLIGFVVKPPPQIQALGLLLFGEEDNPVDEVSIIAVFDAMEAENSLDTMSKCRKPQDRKRLFESCDIIISQCDKLEFERFQHQLQRSNSNTDWLGEFLHQIKAFQE